MGLLDYLTSGDAGGSGLLGGLPASWQYQNPVDDETKKQQAQIAADQFAAAAAGGMPSPTPPPASPFGPVPAVAPPPQPPSIFSTGTGGIGAGYGGIGAQPQSGPIAGAFPPAPIFAPQPSANNQPSPLDTAQWPAGPVGAPSPPQNNAPVPAPQSGPINTMDIGGYQMPQFGSVADYTPTATLPANAQPAQGQLPAAGPAAQSQPLPPALGGRPSGFLGGLNAGLQSLGHGGSLIGALTGNRTDPQSIQQQNLGAQYQSIRQTLIDNGEAPDKAASKAMLAVMNPEAGKTILAEALTNREKFGETGSDAFGNKTMGFINERDQTINGKPIGSDSNAASSTGFLASGVKSIDSGLKGKDYLEQFSPEVQAAVQNYVDGKSTPTGNPRKGFTQTVKMIAQKYGADTGQSVDDASYSARRTMRNQLSSSAPSSLGGQINIGNTAAGHLADLTQKATELGNVDTGIAPLTAMVNGVRGLGTEQAAKMEALKGAAQHYGQEITKFYAGSPGGTAERDRFIESVNGARSPKELAAILSTEGELMRSRLDALGGQIKGVLGDEGLKEYPVLRPDGAAALAKVEANVSKLRGGQSATAGGISEGATATNPQTGQTLTFRGGKWQ